MRSGTTAERQAMFSVTAVRSDVAAGLVSSTVAIPLAMAFGMFAFVSLGDAYFAYGAMAGLVSAAIAGVGCRVLCDRYHPRYAPRINTTLFLRLLPYSFVQLDTPVRCATSG